MARKFGEKFLKNQLKKAISRLTDQEKNERREDTYFKRKNSPTSKKAGYSKRTHHQRRNNARIPKNANLSWSRFGSANEPIESPINPPFL